MHTGSDNQLKLIAIVLPEPLFSFVKQEQNYIASHWNCKHALRTPPHITLIPPILPNKADYKSLESILESVATQTIPFHLEILKFGAFRPRVIFLEPSYSEELKNLYYGIREALNIQMPLLLKRYPDQDFHPHITLAHRDVEKHFFRELWDHYKNKEVNFLIRIHSFSLLTNTPEGWVEVKKFQLVS